MASIDINVVQNSIVLTDFERLQEQEKQPKLGCYRGKSLVIISYQTDGIIEKITEVFKQILWEILQFLSVISTDENDLETLKEAVYQYHLQQIESYKQEELNTLEENHITIRNRYQEELQQLQRDKIQSEEESTGLRGQVDDLTKHKSQIWQQISDLKKQKSEKESEYTQAKLLLESKQALDLDVKSLKSQENTLRKTVQELEKIKKDLIPARKELKELEARINDISQRDFQFLYASLQAQYLTLETEYTEFQAFCQSQHQHQISFSRY